MLQLIHILFLIWIDHFEILRILLLENVEYEVLD